MSDTHGRAEGRILVVDDTRANLHLLSQMLLKEGYKVHAVTSGSRALESAAMAPPDLVLLDVRMPEMDGYEVCRRLKADPRTSDAPVIFISALDATQDKVEAFDVGGVDYVTKPFQMEEVLARVDTHLSLRRLRQQLLDANRKMERELALAGEIQASFLPTQVPQIDGWQIAAALRPARETSGDFYDLIPLPDGRLGIFIADVVDKGVGAALFMALSWTLIRTYTAEYPNHPAEAFAAANRRLLLDTHATQFVTLFYGILDPVEGSLLYCNAGHCPPLLVSQDGAEPVRRLARTGLPLGVVDGERWEEGRASLRQGDMLVLYTDGITEAQSEAGDFFGEPRLVDTVRALVGGTADRSLDAILAQVATFVGDAVAYDDIALIVAVCEACV